MEKYCQDIDINDSETTQVKLINLAGKNKQVLEFGCANGRMSRYLKENGCRVTGIEIDPRKAKAAGIFCEEVIVGDIEDATILQKIKTKFDIIIFGDVLEHLKNPGHILGAVSGFLKENGCVLVSIPNIAYFTVRKNLLLGRFEYEDKGGIIDSEHIRFFTLSSAKEMFFECGYDIDRLEILSVPRFKKCPLLYNLLKTLPSLFGYEFIFKLRPRTRNQ